uniref:Uncharacterized protein n=1 Tax=Salix viminalis TaxID=40686 RepID=A0A6N2LZA4_SALVM
MFLTESLLLQYSQHKPAYNDEEKVLKLRLNDPELRCSHKNLSFLVLTVEYLMDVWPIKACALSISVMKTQIFAIIIIIIIIFFVVHKGTIGGVWASLQLIRCMFGPFDLLLTHNEDDKVSLDINSSSSVNYQTYVNSGLSTALPAYGSDNVSLDINSTSYIPKDADLPRVVLCLAHNGKVVWDVKWQPCNAPPSKCQHRMSYLVVLLGNGCLEVWDVPLPHAMKSVYSSSNLEGIDPRFVKIKPVFRCSTLNCGGFQR